jgi:hypothetical protein
MTYKELVTIHNKLRAQYGYNDSTVRYYANKIIKITGRYKAGFHYLINAF